MNNKTALITGVNGQDGSYLSELLLNKNYVVYGMVRRSSTNTHGRLYKIKENPNFKLVEGDVTDTSSINHIVKEYRPNEIYNLAAQSHVFSSFQQPSFTFQVNAVGVLNLLEAIRLFSPDSRFYQAGTSEMFGANLGKLYTIDGNYAVYKQDETTVFEPQSPYAVAKVAAHNLVINYRKSYKMFACNGILFNHDSPRRGEQFVTRKITKYVAKLYNYLRSTEHMDDLIFGRNISPNYPKLKLGNLDSYRDFGYTGDYVMAMYLMMQQNKPDDFVIATGETHSIRQLLNIAFNEIGLSWEDFVEIDSSLIRPSEVPYLCGNSTKAYDTLKWRPEITFKELISMMVLEDIKNEKQSRNKN